MKTIHICVIFSFILSFSAWAQDIDMSMRDVSLKVINKRGRAVNGIIVQSINAGKAGITDRSGLFVFVDMTDNDTISLILPRYGETMIPVAGMDSIVVTLRSARLYSYMNTDGQNVNVEKNKTEPNTLLDVPALMKQQHFNSLVDLLQGRVAGLNITQSGGRSGEVTTNIRGERSFLLSSEPLVVLDGMPMGTLTEVNAFLNVRDVKTIEVQKGASEWGARGSNGVILIKTKK